MTNILFQYLFADQSFHYELSMSRKVVYYKKKKSNDIAQTKLIYMNWSYCQICTACCLLWHGLGTKTLQTIHVQQQLIST